MGARCRKDGEQGEGEGDTLLHLVGRQPLCLPSLGQGEGSPSRERLCSPLSCGDEQSLGWGLGLAQVLTGYDLGQISAPR